ncbi:MAG: hypothetical protein ACTSXA_02535 [Candidatus Heimdallarchaeota archaeon]
MKRNWILTLLFILAAFIVGLGLFLLFYYPEKFYPMIILGFGGVFFIVLIFLLAFLKVEPQLKKNEQATLSIPPQNIQQTFDAYDQRVERALKIALEKQDDLSMLKASSVDRYTRKLEKDDVCMVCKLLLNKKDDILQCPRCESLFHNEHLLEWIKVRKKCPVCSHILYEKKGNR